jgi:hypothetical protein
MSSARLLGYRFCLRQLGLTPWPLSGESRLGPGQSPGRNAGHRVQVDPQLLAVPAEGDSAIPAHLEFALRREGIDLAAMAAVCAAMDPLPLAAWISERPSSKYARRLGFLYEWLTGRELPVDVTRIAGSYEPVLDPQVYFTGPASTVARWHVRDNLPGTAEWCPTVHREGAPGHPVGTLDVAAQIAGARAHLPREIWSQAVAVAALAEVQASYSLAGERASPAQESAVVRLLRTAGEVPVAGRLEPARLIQLQGALFRGAAHHAAYGLRREEGFAGSPGSTGFQRIEYPFPPPGALESLLRGLAASVERLNEAEVPLPVLSAVVGFGFGFVHPLLEGNGRVHRYLLQAALAAGGALKGGSVIPVSEVMLVRPQEHEEVQRAYSAPLRASAEALAGVPLVLEPGQRFSFPGYERVAALYRFPVLTAQVLYLEGALRQGIDSGLREEAHRLQAQAEERSRLAASLGMPLARLDLLMRIIRQQGGALPPGSLHGQRTRIDRVALQELQDTAMASSSTHIRRKGSRHSKSGRARSG